MQKERLSDKRVPFLAYLPYPLRCDGNHRNIKLARNIRNIKLEIIIFFNKLVVLIPKGKRIENMAKETQNKGLIQSTKLSLLWSLGEVIRAALPPFFFFLGEADSQKETLNEVPN